MTVHWDKLPHDGQAIYEVTSRKLINKLNTARDTRQVALARRLDILCQYTRKIFGPSARVYNVWSTNSNQLRSVSTIDIELPVKLSTHLRDVGLTQSALNAALQARVDAVLHPHGRVPQLKVRGDLYSDGKRMTAHLDFAGGSRNVIGKELAAVKSDDESRILKEMVTEPDAMFIRGGSLYTSHLHYLVGRWYVFRPITDEPLQAPIGCRRLKLSQFWRQREQGSVA